MPIKVHYAVFGTPTSSADVTQVCQNIVDSGNDDIAVNATTMGVDPGPGVVKNFVIVYQLPNAQLGDCYRTKTAVSPQTIDLVP
jgi:hypothetical protein